MKMKNKFSKEDHDVKIAQKKKAIEKKQKTKDKKRRLEVEND